MRIINIISYLMIWSCVSINASKSFNLLTEDQKPSKPLLELLDLLDIKHDGSLKDIVEKTQTSWLRKADTERWHMKDTYQHRDKIFSLLDQIGVLNEVIPTKNSYNYLLLHGAAFSRIQKRLAEALKLWEKGIRFNKLVLLTGERPLDPEVESRDRLLNQDAYAITLDPNWQPPDI